jgi:hypothetical protein
MRAMLTSLYFIDLMTVVRLENNTPGSELIHNAVL